MMLVKRKMPAIKIKIKVTSRQINEVANKIKPTLPVLSQTYADLAVEVAVNLKGVTKIYADSPLAIEIRSL
jgi:hypothetical protein